MSKVHVALYRPIDSTTSEVVGASVIREKASDALATRIRADFGGEIRDLGISPEDWSIVDHMDEILAGSGADARAVETDLL